MTRERREHVYALLHSAILLSETPLYYTQTEVDEIHAVVGLDFSRVLEPLGSEPESCRVTSAKSLLLR